MNSSSSCASCALVASVVDKSYTSSSTVSQRKLQPVIGTFLELEQNQTCEVCKFVVFKLREDPRRDGYLPDCAVTFWQWSEPMEYTWSYGPLENEDGNCTTCDQDHRGFRLIDFALPSPKFGYFVEPDSNWIDLCRVREWSSHCDSTHAGLCHTLTEWADVAPPSLAPLLLVDVNARCIVEIDVSANLRTKYAALSYVWGRLPNVLEATRSNLGHLKMPGALSLTDFSDTLPATVRDAVALTRSLDLDYLWVDRLCIVQDDPASKSLQLAQMGAIYANSYMTLVAADGTDANYGLRGSVRGVSQPRDFQLPVLTYKPDGESLIVEPVFELDFNAPEWQRRGWTFQERTLSRRNLVFQEGRVFWECPGVVWTEELAYGPRTTSQDFRWQRGKPSSWQRSKPSSYQLKMSRWPDLGQYEMLVLAYNMRVLSFPSDGLNAFVGISTALSRSFRGGLLYGVPEYYFDIAMLWFPFSPIHRRLVNDRVDYTLPSWSWVGWAGGNINLSILPQLQRRADATMGLEEEIDNGYHDAVKMKNDKYISLPKGWSRIAMTEGNDIGQGFKHDSIPDTVFTWPLHVPEHPLPPSLVQWNPRLRFQTTRAFLFVGSRLRHNWEGNSWNAATNMAVPIASSYNIRDMSGAWAGVLYSNGSDTIPAAENQRCEFIVISGGVTSKDTVDDHNGLEEWAQTPEIQDLETYEFFNVLWIEWVDAIAYRKGLGRIWQEAWKRQHREELEVVLG
ncbi:heterokaryon incompatibility protein-domain-containing protein [Truncatella angustata]|uniref:Heterokaryon incompatibility protein-domain-containing protein n=1 Tax=Truncatella angustata TaxID=152316 RepID=A0A9P8RKF6_9PEZI|nr:heterokaryon incompatibility protein-domain-containing protein [Truncatella angustata]KAH6643385.1 heterokaryon incompatibility protein-domain-containing protein [Truncatella angustata]